MEFYQPLHDLIFAVLPDMTIRITGGGLLAAALLTVGVIGELWTWRRDFR